MIRNTLGIKSFNNSRSMKFIILLVTLSVVIQPGDNEGFFSSFYNNVANILQYEICEEPWILTNLTGLKYALKNSLYGQHLVLRTVVSHITGHVTSVHPNKALALSLHGGPGTGKNYVSKMIASHLFKEGMKSKFVHLIASTKEFPHESMVPHYKNQLQSWIQGNVSACAHSLFIFDEMDKMPRGLIDIIKPYLDYYDHLSGIDYRKSIFLFLSNTAGNEINKLTLEYWNIGTKRENIKLKEMESIIINSAVNAKGGMWHSDLITKHLITAFIPFLPLTRNHVAQCIRNVIHNNDVPYTSIARVIEDVIDELSFYPEEEIFSVTGCKRVAEKVIYVTLK